MVTWKLELPEAPSPNFIHVSQISLKSDEKTAFELQLDEDGTNQEALIEFERESAARTAALLSNALIDDSHIVVGPFYSSEFIFDDKASDAGSDASQETKPKSRIVAEILANGYLLQDQIVAKGLEYDQRYHFTDKLNVYFSMLQSNVKQFDEKYRIWDMAKEMHEKYKIQEKVDLAMNKAQEALQSPTGQKLHGMANLTMAQIAAVHYEAKRIQLHKLGIMTDASDKTTDDSVPAETTMPATVQNSTIVA
ncbi:hypothetical protein BC940DRAFT_160716 [Gongronella butleri]|nr:hypothetical protein BC940DRAFT_160716 [Gongronella butleri]